MFSRVHSTLARRTRCALHSHFLSTNLARLPSVSERPAALPLIAQAIRPSSSFPAARGPTAFQRPLSSARLLASHPASTSSAHSQQLQPFSSSTAPATPAPAPTAAPSLDMSAVVKDHSSQSNFHELRVVHSSYELDVDFERRVLEGYVELDAVAQVPAPSQLVLDTRDLSITAVHLLPLPLPGEQQGQEQGHPAADPVPLEFNLGERHKVLGSPLVIRLPPALAPSLQQPGGRVRVALRFATCPSSSALQWLSPQQTAGGSHPYLFTQCQAIHARALVPCQDSPGAKMSYDAVVRVPYPLTALMSAVPREEAGQGQGQGEQPDVPHLASVQHPYPTRTFAFMQKVPIAPYLVALAVGELESRELGPRTRVWSEPSMVEAGAHEFADTGSYLEAGEAIAGEYVWGRYDLLLLPPSFPYGGMENPCLTFVTPTLLAGDRSLTNVVAHEIAHSWTGNLVTNASWEHFWLNEGFTVFLERKIVGRLRGPAAFHFHAAQGALTLEAELARLGPDHPHTALVPDLSGGVDPDDVFSSIPYEKGFYFLFYLQELVGGPEVFDPFLSAYISAHRHRTLTSGQFRDFFLNYFKDVPASRTVDWDTWLYAPGPPPATNTYDTSLAQAAYDLASKWHTCDVIGLGSDGPPGASPADVSGWSSEQLVAFLKRLGQLRAPQPMHKRTTARLAELYGIYESKNTEIRFAFFKLAIPAKDEAAMSAASDMLRSQGRMKFLRPLYRALFSQGGPVGRQLALDTFAAAGASYHPIAQKMVAADLGL
ncbi:hypothetical protein Agub_g11207 [Astrephomene gubernaculifera]|uniref:Leucine aminopeptidase n=1 Tax=Astrephomene gubernaculifera TaxID=47775 RepID=A0AAD3DWK0_9CHLO|nr:hypothetical protein Agub_g11207 [Astrephomene gubernaculifera]